MTQNEHTPGLARVTLTVPVAQLGDAIARLISEGWTIRRSDPDPDPTSPGTFHIVAEREIFMPTTRTKIGEPLPKRAEVVPEPIPPPTVPRSIGVRFREAREKANLSGIVVAESIRSAPSFVYDVEAGRRVPDMETTWRLSLAIGEDPATFDDRLASVPAGEIGRRLEEARRRQAVKIQGMKPKEKKPTKGGKKSG